MKCFLLTDIFIDEYQRHGDRKTNDAKNNYEKVINKVLITKFTKIG